MGTLLCTTPLEKFGPIGQHKDTNLPVFHKLLETQWKNLNQTSNLNEDLPKEISPLQLELLELMGSYKDLYFPETCPLNRGPQVRSAYCLHVLNHVLKANSQVLAHNAQLREQKTQAKPGAEPHDEPRDQGLTRPKVKDCKTELQVSLFNFKSFTCIIITAKAYVIWTFFLDLVKILCFQNKKNICLFSYNFYNCLLITGSATLGINCWNEVFRA